MHVSLISEKLSIRCGMKVFFTAFFNMILGGNVYELIESLYWKSSCSVKIGKYETSKFLIVMV